MTSSEAVVVVVPPRRGSFHPCKFLVAVAASLTVFDCNTCVAPYDAHTLHAAGLFRASQYTIHACSSWLRHCCCPGGGLYGGGAGGLGVGVAGGFQSPGGSLAVGSCPVAVSPLFYASPSERARFSSTVSIFDFDCMGSALSIWPAGLHVALLGELLFVLHGSLSTQYSTSMVPFSWAVVLTALHALLAVA